MKFLKWVWFVALIIMLFQAANPIIAAVNGDEYERIPDSFFGTLFIFLFLSLVIFAMWTLKLIFRLLKKMFGRGQAADSASV